jgi:predicted metalloprotease with PDZ domain
VDVLTYEIEFLTKGSKREMVASPEGVIPHLWAPIEEKDLPKAVAETVAKEVPEGKFESAARFEIRAGLQFAPIETPRIVYQLELEKDGKPSKLNLRADGSAIPAPVRPGAQNRAYLGLAFEQNSMTVSQVVKDGPAEQAGIKIGDKILALGDTKVASVKELLLALSSLKPGTEVKLHYRRDDKDSSVSVKLGTPQ